MDDQVDDEERLAAVGATAVVVAICRAVESHRVDSWFSDPLADHVERVAEPTPETKLRPGLVFWVAVRTRFLDELMLDALGRGVEQFALLGAGLDARAFRLRLPETTLVFEIDRAPVLALKRRLVAEIGLRATCDRREVAADITEPGWIDLLRAQGWNPGLPTCWLAEGLLVYLEPTARDHLLTTLARTSPPGSRLGATLTSARRAEQVALFRSGVEGDPREWLESLGWQATAANLPEVAGRYGRPVSEKAAAAASAILIDASPLPR